MTGREAYDIFQSIVDNYTDEYVSEVKFSRLFNTASLKLLSNELLPFENRERRMATDEPKVSIENTQINLEDWGPLVHYDTATPIVGGNITLSSIELTLPDSVKRDEAGLIATEKPKIRHILSLRVSTDGVSYVGARWRRHNDRIVVDNDPFREPTTEYPIYYNAQNSWRVQPTSFLTCLATFIREPVFFWYEGAGSGNNVDPELSDSMCERVIHLAAKMSGLSHRDAELVNNITSIEDVST